MQQSRAGYRLCLPIDHLKINRLYVCFSFDFYRELAEIQINAGCFESLSNGSEFLSYIPLMTTTL